VGSVRSWQGPQANSTLLIRAGVAASLTHAKDLDVTVDKNNRDLRASQRKAACWLPKADGWSFPLWTGQAGAPGLALARCACLQALSLPAKLGEEPGRVRKVQRGSR